MTDDRDRRYIVHLTDGKRLEPDICKVANGSEWLYCCWKDDETGHKQRKYPPQKVRYYESLPVGDDR